MAAHGWNHAFGGGKLSRTVLWFASIGMRPPRAHAWVATLTGAGGHAPGYPGRVRAWPEPRAGAPARIDHGCHAAPASATLRQQSSQAAHLAALTVLD